MVSKTSRYMVLATSVITFLLSVLQWSSSKELHDFPSNIKENYNSTYDRFNSIDKAINYLDSLALVKHFPINNSREYVDYVDTLLRNRFFHGYSYYGINDDYISFFLGKYIWFDLYASVDPEFIISHSQAACSQQSIVFMEILKRKGYKVRKVGLKGHFCTSVFYDNKWHFYDTNIEPVFEKNKPVPSTIQLITDKQLLYKAYRGKLSKERIDYMFANPQFEVIDELPGKNIRLFHKITHFLSHTLWLFMLVLYVLIDYSSFKARVVYVWNRRLLFKPKKVYAN